jgi:hypothetical protein
MGASSRTCALIFAAATWFSCEPATGASLHRAVELLPAGRIGPGWEGDGSRWMSFVAFNRHGDRIASDAAANPEDRSDGLTIWTFPGGRLVRRLPGSVTNEGTGAIFPAPPRPQDAMLLPPHSSFWDETRPDQGGVSASRQERKPAPVRIPDPIQGPLRAQ